MHFVYLYAGAFKANPDAVKQARLQREIEVLKKEITNLRSQLERSQAELDSVKTQVRQKP